MDLAAHHHADYGDTLDNLFPPSANGDGTDGAVAMGPRVRGDAGQEMLREPWRVRGGAQNRKRPRREGCTCLTCPRPVYLHCLPSTQVRLLPGCKASYVETPALPPAGDASIAGGDTPALNSSISGVGAGGTGAAANTSAMPLLACTPGCCFNALWQVGWEGRWHEMGM